MTRSLLLAAILFLTWAPLQADAPAGIVTAGFLSNVTAWLVPFRIAEPLICTPT